MARLLDVPAAQLEPTGHWVAQFVRGIAPGASARDVASASGAAQALMEQGRQQGLDSVRAANRIAFMQQSADATAALMGLAVLMLAREPQQAAAADASLDAMRQFVAETERHQAPTQNTRRFAAQPLELAGQPVDAGQGILVVLAGANRDEALNSRPDSFEPQRPQRRSMGFGFGRHACPGAAIAIEIVAAGVSWMRAGGQFDAFFGRHSGFRPLGNIRSPVFES
jgi:cytochrome P450